jgi:hypothetical protein
MVLQRLGAKARWAVALVALGLVGCYSYIPAQVGGPVRGTAVRARLRNDPEFQVGDLRVRDVAVVEGEVISWEPDTLALSATELRSDGGESFNGGGYTVKLSLSDLTDVSIKQLSRTRTVLVAVGAVAAALLGQRALTGAFNAQGNGASGGSKQ